MTVLDAVVGAVAPHTKQCAFDGLKRSTCTCDIWPAQQEIDGMRARIRELERRNRVLDVVQAHDRWARDGDPGQRQTLLNTIEALHQEIENG